jgi:hypothetical protein
MSTQSTKARQREQERAQAKAARSEAARRERFKNRVRTRLQRRGTVGGPLIAFFRPLAISVDLRLRMTDDLYLVGGKPFGSAGQSQKNWDPEIDGFVARLA